MATPDADASPDRDPKQSGRFASASISQTFDGRLSVSATAPAAQPRTRTGLVASLIFHGILLALFLILGVGLLNQPDRAPNVVALETKVVDTKDLEKDDPLPELEMPEISREREEVVEAEEPPALHVDFMDSEDPPAVEMGIIGLGKDTGYRVERRRTHAGEREGVDGGTGDGEQMEVVPPPPVGKTCPARCIKEIDPEYPEALVSRGPRRARAIALMYLDENGRVTRVEFEKSTRWKKLNNAVVKALLKWTFEPAYENGVAISSTFKPRPIVFVNPNR